MQSQPIHLTVVPRNLLEQALAQLTRLGDDGASGARIAQELTSLEMPFLAAAVERNVNPVPLRSVFKIAVKMHGATCCIVESPYLDLEYWDSYAHVYGRSFRNYSKACVRLHFFRGPEGKEERLRRRLLSNGSERHVRKLGFEYLGFAVLRPTASYNVGRVALLFDEAKGSQRTVPPDPDDPEYEGIPRCKGRSQQEANLLGASLAVRAVPFVQQDVVTGMCATASCWSASQVLANRHDLHKFPYLEITRNAFSEALRGESGAIPPERGLDLEHVRRALAKTGANPQVVLAAEKAVDDAFDHRVSIIMRHALYTFVESHIPVIVLLDNRDGRQLHAVCAVGHLQPDIRDFRTVEHAVHSGLYKDMPDTNYLVSETVLRCYVNDDAYGPYNRMDFLSPGEHIDLNRPLNDSQKYRCPVRLKGRNERKTKKPLVLDIVGLVAPVPPYVRNRPDAVTENAVRAFVAKQVAEQMSHKAAEAFGVEGLEYQTLWRTVLTKGSAFKQSLAQRGYPRAHRSAYASLHMPKYMWVCEFTLFEKRQAHDVLGAEDRRIIHGEILFDTSTPSFDLTPIALSLIHI